MKGYFETPYVVSSIDWHSTENHLFINPTWPKAVYDQLVFGAQKIWEEHQIYSHIWITTSGTTTFTDNRNLFPKLVALSKIALLNSARTVNEFINATHEDRWLKVIPTYHVGGLGILSRASLTQSPVIEIQQKWDAQLFLEKVENEEISITSLVPTQLFDLVKCNFVAPRRLRVVFVGGAFLAPSLYLQARSLGWPVLPTYGMTETASMIAAAHLDTLKIFEFPKVFPLPHAKIQCDEGKKIKIKATSLLTGYAVYKDECWSFIDPKQRDGWFFTDDCGNMDITNGLKILGRNKEVIKIGGELVNLSFLKQILKEIIQSYEFLFNFTEFKYKIDLIYLSDVRLENIIALRIAFYDQQSKLLKWEEDPSMIEIVEKIVEKFNSSVRPFEKIREYRS